MLVESKRLWHCAVLVAWCWSIVVEKEGGEFEIFKPTKFTLELVQYLVLGRHQLSPLPAQLNQ